MQKSSGFWKDLAGWKCSVLNSTYLRSCPPTTEPEPHFAPVPAHRFSHRAPALRPGRFPPRNSLIRREPPGRGCRHFPRLRLLPWNPNAPRLHRYDSLLAPPHDAQDCHWQLPITIARRDKARQRRIRGDRPWVSAPRFTQRGCPRSFFTISPSFITNTTFSMTAMSVSGSPFTATMSANLPTSMVPRSFVQPRRSAALTVAA